MNEKEIQEENILIAEWLGWTWHENYLRNNGIPNQIELFYPYELSFHDDSNWQWECLKKIMDNHETIKDLPNLINHLNGNWREINYHPTKNKDYWSINIRTKQDLFEAIINYIKSNKND